MKEEGTLRSLFNSRGAQSFRLELKHPRGFQHSIGRICTHLALKETGLLQKQEGSLRYNAIERNWKLFPSLRNTLRHIPGAQ